jgi:hypothetical protein
VPAFGLCTLIELMPVMTGSRADQSAQRFIGNPMPETCAVDDHNNNDGRAIRVADSSDFAAYKFAKKEKSVSPNYLRRPSLETTVL